MNSFTFWIRFVFLSFVTFRFKCVSLFIVLNDERQEATQWIDLAIFVFSFKPFWSLDAMDEFNSEVLFTLSADNHAELLTYFPMYDRLCNSNKLKRRLAKVCMTGKEPAYHLCIRAY